MVLMSDSRGALVSVRGSSDSSVAGISVRQAFFAPAIGIGPRERPVAAYQMIESMVLPQLSCGSSPG